MCVIELPIPCVAGTIAIGRDRSDSLRKLLYGRAKIGIGGGHCVRWYGVTFLLSMPTDRMLENKRLVQRDKKLPADVPVRLPSCLSIGRARVTW